MTRLEKLRIEVETLESEIKVTEQVLEYLDKMRTRYTEKQGQLVMKLNRARRLEREELQNG